MLSTAVILGADLEACIQLKDVQGTSMGHCSLQVSGKPSLFMFHQFRAS